MAAILEDISNYFLETIHFARQSFAQSLSASEKSEFVAHRQVDDYWGFLKSIPWRENWLVSLLVFHILSFVLIIQTHDRHNIQCVIFLFLLLIIGLSERLNEYAAGNWRSFSTENFFDSSGLFTSTVLSFPIIINCLTLIISWLYAAGNSLVDIKRKQLQASVTSNAEKKTK